MNIGCFGTTIGLLGHGLKFHIEINTLFDWFAYSFVYSERTNGCYVILELCKIQLLCSWGSNVQDMYEFTDTSFFIRQDHAKDPNMDDVPEELAKYIDGEEE